MERKDAIGRLKELEGQELRKLADYYNVTVWKDGKLNKGWAGHVIERYLGLPLNSAQSPNFGSWELKIVPLKVSLTGEMGVFVQPRTKGPGHGSTSRAFYARKELVAHILGLKD